MASDVPTVNTIALGSQGLRVTEIGYGCMGLTSAYNTKLPEPDIIDMLEHVAASGVTLWDTANIYVYPDFTRLLRLQSPIVCQEEIIAKAIEKVGREKLTIATKTGLRISVFPKPTLTPDGSPEFIRQECEASLKRLGIDCIDLFYLHRIDPNTPIEISMLEMKKLVEEGKIKYVGLSECSAATLRRAHAVQPVTALQMEYSLWSRDIEDDVMETCKELGVGIVAYSPLGRGFFAGSANSTAAKGEFKAGDYRSGQPRMVGEAGEKNREMLKKVEQIAEEKGVSTAQLSLAWVRAQQHRVGGAGVVAIPGTTKKKNLDSNVGSVAIELSVEEIQALEAAVAPEAVSGDRYDDSHHTWQTDKNRELTDEEKTKYGL